MINCVCEWADTNQKRIVMCRAHTAEVRREVEYFLGKEREKIEKLANAAAWHLLEGTDESRTRLRAAYLEYERDAK